MKYTKVIVTAIQEFWIASDGPPRLMKDLQIIDSQNCDSRDSQHTNQITRFRIDKTWQKTIDRDKDNLNVIYPIKAEKQYIIAAKDHFIDFNNLP